MGITLGALLPIGSVIHSMLTESQFQGQTGSGWILADGRSVTGSIYATVTGASTIPDMRGAFLRAKNNGSTRNPDGDLALGAYTADKFASHNHSVPAESASGSSSAQTTTVNTTVSNGVTGSVGGNETAPKSITVNIFIRIN